MGWSWFLALYAGLTAWIIMGPVLVPLELFTWVKNVAYVAVMMVGVWVSRDSLARSWRQTRQRPLQTVGMIVIGLALMGVASGASQLVMFLVGDVPAGQNQAAISSEVLAASTSLAGGLFFIGLGGVVAPVVEELVFREFPFGRLRHVLSTQAAFLLSGLVFTAIHLRSMDEWPLAILYFGYAAALATVYLLSSRNLVASIGTHSLWNGTGLAFLLVTAW